MRIVAQVLDGTYGKPAVGVPARLARMTDNSWRTVFDTETNGDGSVEEWGSLPLERGFYRIVFDSDSYFAQLGATSAYPEVIVIFRMQSESHAFHVQVMLSPHSYTTYFETMDNRSSNSG